MEKKELRAKYKQLREALTSVACDEKSLAIANNLLQLDIWSFETYHVFLTIEKLKEINTEYLLNILNGKDKNIVVSKSDFEASTMQHFLLTDNTTLKINSWGIPEPQNGFEVQPQQIDVVFIPLLAFDKQGNRLGYGKGFYDRFLASCKTDCLKIGLSFFEAEDALEFSAYDIPLTHCVTPNKTYRF